MNDYQRATTGANPALAFTLIELLVVVFIIALLIALTIPALAGARESGKRTVCLANLHQVGTAIHAYANEFGNNIPFGPDGRAQTGSNFYPYAGDVTSLISLEPNGDAVGLGLLLRRNLSAQSKVLFCPAVDQPTDANTQLARVGVGQAQSDYYYRHGSMTVIYPPRPPSPPPATPQTMINNLGLNRRSQPIGALVMDVQFRADSFLAPFGIVTRTSHRQAIVNVLYNDGHAATLNNGNGQYTANVGRLALAALDMILTSFENADAAR